MIKMGGEVGRALAIALFSLFFIPSAFAVTAPVPQKISTYSRGDAGMTGDLSLEIPLLEVPGRAGMALPISAFYQAGVRVDQPPGLIGLGWQLELGHVERIPMNIVDFHNTDDKSTAEDDFRFTALDPLPDAFLVEFPTGSIKFLNKGTLEFPEFVPESENTPYSFKVLDTNCDFFEYTCDYSGFVLTTADGTRYVYDYAVKETVADVYDDGDEGRSPNPSIPGNMRWMLSAILEANYKDGGSPDLDYNPVNSLGTNKGNWIAISYTTGTHHYVFEGDSRAFHREAAYPQSVTAPDYYANFYYRDIGDFGTPDDYQFTLHEINPGSSVPDGNYDNAEKEPLKHLHEIVLVSSASGAAIRDVIFTYNTVNSVATTSGTANPVSCLSEGLAGIPDGTPLSRLMLTRIDVAGKGGATMPPYEFSYYEGPDAYGVSSSKTPSCSRATGDFRDVFGYYTTNADGFDIANENEADAEFDLLYGKTEAKAWSLNKVSYPTGLMVTYSYENDKIYQDFSIPGVYSDTTDRKYYMGGIRLVSTVMSDPSGGNSLAYAQDYSGGVIAGDSVGIISRKPQAFIISKLGSGYYFMPSVFQDIPEFVYYPQTKTVLPGGTGYVLKKFSYRLNPFGFDASQLISGSSICFSNLLQAWDWCESSSSHGGKTLAAFLPDDADGFIGFPSAVEYYGQSGALVRKEENLEDDGSSTFPWSKILDESMARVAGMPVFKSRVHLPVKRKVTTYDPADVNKYTVLATAYSYSDKGPITIGSYSLSSHAILPVSSSECKSDATGACTGPVKTYTTVYAFDDSSLIPQNVRDKLKEKFMLSLASQKISPVGTVRQTYKIIPD